MIYSYAKFGYEGSLVNVEVDLRRGIPAVDIVGLADGAVKEERERVKSAIVNSGFEFPQERVLISLSPADLKKEGACFDLPIALEILRRQFEAWGNDTKVIEDVSKNVLVMGELELSGKVRQVRGVFGACKNAIENGIEYVIVPKGSDVPQGIKYCEVDSLEQAYNALFNFPKFKERGDIEMKGFSTPENPIFDEVSQKESLDGIKGHNGLKFAMAVAVAGRHNILTYGKPGCGKTMVLQRMTQLMPHLTFEESQSVSRIYSLSGLTKLNETYRKVRPFRIPHQTATIEGMCGGGIHCNAGEISLAHNGVLFLDEAAEFRTSVLQMLRVPLECGTITLARAGRSTMFPSKFQLVMATNPCPCGNFGSKDKICLCSMKSVEQYWRKFSAPLLDRVAIRFNAEGEYQSKELTDDASVLKAWSLKELREMIFNAWKRQYERQGKLNQDLAIEELFDKILSANEINILSKALHKHEEFSQRENGNVGRMARTIADMQNKDRIDENDVKLALELHEKLPIENL